MLFIRLTRTAITNCLLKFDFSRAKGLSVRDWIELMSVLIYRSPFLFHLKFTFRLSHHTLPVHQANKKNFIFCVKELAVEVKY